LTDGQGRVVDFRNTVLIMTSNLGTEFIRRGGTLGFLQNEGTKEDKEANIKIEKSLKETFRPEFLNRIDEVIIFSPLSLEQMHKIVDLQMDEIRQRLAEHGLQVELAEDARQWLASQGFDPSFGARPLKRTLQKYVESPLSISLLSGDFKDGDKVLVNLNEKEGKLEFTKAK
jgi:ATP-dependent Clp protease ATP-binding subunit ClpC